MENKTPVSGAVRIVLMVRTAGWNYGQFCKRHDFDRLSGYANQEKHLKRQASLTRTVRCGNPGSHNGGKNTRSGIFCEEASFTDVNRILKSEMW